MDLGWKHLSSCLCSIWIDLDSTVLAALAGSMCECATLLVAQWSFCTVLTQWAILSYLVSAPPYITMQKDNTANQQKP